MSPSKSPKKVAFNCKEEVVITAIEEELTNEEDEIPPPVETNNNNNSTSSSTVGLRKEFLRLESLVRCHVQHQWHLSIENYRCLISLLIEQINLGRSFFEPNDDELCL
jgi:hypothetical protein